MTSTRRRKPQHTFHMTRLSGNEKTGAIPVSTTSRSTCPDRCSLKNSGCYAESGRIAIHWDRVSRGQGKTLEGFCEDIRGLPKYQLWRYGQAGDVPGDGRVIDKVALEMITHANRGRHGFGYTHYDPRIPTNAEAIRQANDQGFTLNLSAETLVEADEYVGMGVAPVVVLLPIDQTANFRTPAGNHVTVCPASVSNTTCALCAICAVAGRKAIVGFPAHGTGKAKAQRVFYMKEISTGGTM